jgi:uncharacterized membrane protein
MSESSRLWAVGFDGTGRAAQVRDEIIRLSCEKHCLILLDIAIAVSYADGSFTLNGEPLREVNNIVGRTVACFLAGLALGAPPMTSAAVGTVLGSFGGDTVAVGISRTFVREVERLIKPGTSVLFVLDDGGDMDAILLAIRGLGGTVLKTNVDVEEAKRIQATLAASPDRNQPNCL